MGRKKGEVKAETQETPEQPEAKSESTWSYSESMLIAMRDKLFIETPATKKACDAASEKIGKVINIAGIGVNSNGVTIVYEQGKERSKIFIPSEGK